ncbi:MULTISPECIES: DUF2846 domain-containing protein [unclassified Lysobacter]|uniref:DUF2846 domain-containing protein n=1 Tax=unclassified Lysobacter TaxID=2635362 RepID=UPI0006F65BE6|nr:MULTISPECIES: DUF2846 domain-containing protein [unclassified Lysobacter]KRA16084.1 hypothetical protein ASD69_15220 [Lysobacter sp. Root604]KRD31785.1 hypothetical protein ASE35_12445 [Lysobacter sp. Root916]KRD75653.1 hypothetical protein ASE43_12445 [Lysobacter sp. Root983]
MNLKFRVSALALGLMFSGAVLAQDTAPPAATEASAEEAEDTAADAQPAGKIGVPPQGKGQIVFFRPSKFVGGAVGFKVREGETELGKLRSGKYFVHVAEPGTHEYRVHGETKDVLTMEIEAGETYYVQGTLGMGIVAGRPNLAPTDAAAFNALADKLKLAK